MGTTRTTIDTLCDAYDIGKLYTFNTVAGKRFINLLLNLSVSAGYQELKLVMVRMFDLPTSQHVVPVIIDKNGNRVLRQDVPDHGIDNTTSDSGKPFEKTAFGQQNVEKKDTSLAPSDKNEQEPKRTFLDELKTRISRYKRIDVDNNNNYNDNIN